ncbi:MAG: putative Outer rane chaperone Skp precursor [Nitrospira sp.]|jgi:outer membrane protein|nr:putative Outer rane chaperone Skp precursor [Nitrospira sp.]
MKLRHVIMAGVIQALLGCLAQPAQSADRIKVGMMDQQQVIERSVAGKRALEELKSYSTARQKIIDSDDQELKEIEKVVQDTNLSEEVRKEKQEQFRSKLEAYQRRIQDFNREVQEKQRSMVAEYAEKIRAAASAVAQKQGYTAIIDRGSESTVKIVIYSHPSIDLTEQVIKEFDRQNK